MTKEMTAAEKTKEKQFKEGICRAAKTDTLHTVEVGVRGRVTNHCGIKYGGS